MTKKICIMCEKKKEIDNFSLSRGHSGNYCDDCWNSNGNDYLYEYESNFNYDLFYLKYPSERTANWEEEADIIDSLKRLERKLADNKEILPYYQNTIKNKEMTQDLKKEITRLEKEIRELKLQQRQQTNQVQISPK